ncbi:LPS-assembly lipoprotein LptE [Thiobacillus sedimenti]|uniref:LPS-assembly lipoprotein LptE n=1 Tax=Thiobacillus sedimenti TaxID=3110231 RepID=A0ABZ1CIL5_9PROT|nr:LPS assembly lipoprotein LptE [Thiobacillus sp. SCUT-2]WRS38915.1 LPS assembly lipoprotein LptE [Thiobacillus sp. SCUT-2]
MKRRLFLAAIPALLAAGCGFQLRRFDGVPFGSLYIDAPDDNAVGQRVRAMLATNHRTAIAPRPDEAEAVLKLGREERSKSILSLSGAGRVTEYRLGIKLSYSVLGQARQTLAEPALIELYRDMTYDDTRILAKAAEEQLLYRDMEENAALQIVRRLQALKRPGSP